LSSLFYIGLIEVMKNRLWMYKDSPQGLQMMNYYNEVNYAISNSRNISRDGIKYHTRDIKIKSFSIQI
jgi:hypothetical protein